MKVFKFGGSSVKDAEAIKRVVSIVKSDSECTLVVVSATQNTTNELELIAKAAVSSTEEARELWNKTLSRHTQIIKDLNLTIELSEFCDEVKSLIDKIHNESLISKVKMDQLYSIGERLSSLIIATYFNKIEFKETTLLDAREIILTNDEFSKASPLIKEILNKDFNTKDNQLYITQGFIGSTIEGKTTTLGREGSDFSATLFGELLKCSEVVIWTDVCGVATCDPRIIEGAKFIDHMSYEQAALLAQLGAKVLFERTLEPAQRAGFKVIVKSTLLPQRPGTMISSKVNDHQLIGMAIKDNVVSIVGNNLITNKCLDMFNTECSDYKIHEQSETSFSIKISTQHLESYLEKIHHLILECHHNE